MTRLVLTICGTIVIGHLWHDLVLPICGSIQYLPLAARLLLAICGTIGIGTLWPELILATCGTFLYWVFLARFNIGHLWHDLILLEFWDTQKAALEPGAPKGSGPLVVRQLRQTALDLAMLEVVVRTSHLVHFAVSTPSGSAWFAFASFCRHATPTEI